MTWDQLWTVLGFILNARGLVFFPAVVGSVLAWKRYVQYENIKAADRDADRDALLHNSARDRWWRGYEVAEKYMDEVDPKTFDTMIGALTEEAETYEGLAALEVLATVYKNRAKTRAALKKASGQS